MKRAGFTLIEIMLVVAIVSLLGLGMLPFSANLISKNAVETKTHELYSFLKTAQLNSLLGKGNSPWGVYVDNSSLYLFKGIGFSERDINFDQKITIPNTVTITPAEIVFNKVSGQLSQDYSLTISGQLKTKTLSITNLGVVNVN